MQTQQPISIVSLYFTIGYDPANSKPAKNRAKAAKGLKMSSVVRGSVRGGSHTPAGLIQTISAFHECEHARGVLVFMGRGPSSKRFYTAGVD